MASMPLPIPIPTVSKLLKLLKMKLLLSSPLEQMDSRYKYGNYGWKMMVDLTRVNLYVTSLLVEKRADNSMFDYPLRSDLMF